MKQKPLVAFFSEIDKNDLPLVGGKGANLGEMTKIKAPVPNGFAATTAAYDVFLEENSIQGDIDKILAGLDRSDTDELEVAARKIRKLIKRSKMPKTVADDILKSYKKLSKRFKKALVAVRSSATAEDLPNASFAGQQDTYLNIKGDVNLLESIKKCWASLYTARAIFYREENKIKHSEVKISVIVQKMVQSDVSGTMFSIDPVTNDKERIVIEAVWGLGEMIVQGAVLPDKYVVQKDTYFILSKEVSEQAIQMTKVGEETKVIDVPKKLRTVQKVSDKNIIVLAKIAQKLQEHYYFPQDIEWAIDEDEVFITQTRPVTTTGERKRMVETEDGQLKMAEAPLLSGTSASPGIGTGRVRILKSPKEVSKLEAGEVLVAPMTSPDYVPAMKKAAAIVTDKGGLTSHAAIVSRELGVPAIVGTKTATTTLKNGMAVTVDGTKGQIYMGSKMKVDISKKTKSLRVKKKKTKTATNLYVNLAEVDRAKEIAKEHVDGVGLLRAEFMIADIGIHPKEAIKNKKQGKFIRNLADDLETFAKAFYPRQVVYRTTDFKTNEYRSLEGGKHWEPEESNPMLGFRGAFRYIASPDVFNLELQAIKKVREKYKNLQVMIPFVRSPEELVRVRRMVSSQDLFNSDTFKFWMMVELPVNVIMLPQFIKRGGIHGVSVGSNDLTMLLMGTDRDNSEVAQAFNERDPVVYWALKRVIKTCHKYGITSSICGQAPSTYEDLVENLVKWGITSISVNPDAIYRVREVIAQTEKEIIQ